MSLPPGQRVDVGRVSAHALGQPTTSAADLSEVSVTFSGSVLGNVERHSDNPDRRHDVRGARTGRQAGRYRPCSTNLPGRFRAVASMNTTPGSTRRGVQPSGGLLIQRRLYLGTSVRVVRFHPYADGRNAPTSLAASSHASEKMGGVIRRRPVGRSSRPSEMKFRIDHWVCWPTLSTPTRSRRTRGTAWSSTTPCPPLNIRNVSNDGLKRGRRLPPGRRNQAQVPAGVLFLMTDDRSVINCPMDDCAV